MVSVTSGVGFTRGEAIRRGFGDHNLTARRRSALAAALACASVLAITCSVAAKPAKTHGGPKSSASTAATSSGKAAKRTAAKSKGKGQDKAASGARESVQQIPLVQGPAAET